MTVNVLTAEPTIPAINAPITDWFRKFGTNSVNHEAMPGSDKYPMNPITNPSSQKAKTANLLDNFLSPRVIGFSKYFRIAGLIHIAYEYIW
jgi:hypothetical protein